jgi:glutathione S-transferase
MLKIWGRATSINVQKVMWTIGELGLSYERVDIGGDYGGNAQPEYLRKNPNGLIPTLEEDDFLLWESNACVRYLASKYGAGTLEPADLRDRARASRWMDWQISTAGPAIAELFRGMVRTAPELRDLDQIDRSREKATLCMGLLDVHLAETPYLVGQEFSMGDIPLALVTYRFRRLVPTRPDLRHLDAWFQRIETRPAFAVHVLSIPFA